MATMKPLSLAQAGRCENAEHPACRCRCGGALHGARRGGGGGGGGGGGTEYSRGFFEKLDEDDPHFLPPERESLSDKLALFISQRGVIKRTKGGRIRIKKMSRLEFAAFQILVRLEQDRLRKEKDAAGVDYEEREVEVIEEEGFDER